MKTGKNLGELAAEIMRQAKEKHDYVASTKAMDMSVVNYDSGRTDVLLSVGDVGAFSMTDLAHGQLAETLKIPRPYYERMRVEAPDLLANNVQTWFRKYGPKSHMVRTLDDKVRALLSSSYRPLDNFDLASSVLPVIQDRKLEIMSCELTEKRLYIKAVDMQLFRDVPVGYQMGDGSHRIFDTCAPAIIISNSEVGYGRLSIETGVYTRACTNMCLFSDGAMKKTHLGARHKLIENVENIDHLLSDATRAKTDAALWGQVQDVIAAAFSTDQIGVRLAKLTSASENKIEGRVDKVVEITAKKFALNDDEREQVLKNLIEGGSLTQYGLHAAVTRAAQDAENYDRATEMEYLGGKIIELPRTEWRELALAA